MTNLIAQTKDKGSNHSCKNYRYGNHQNHTDNWRYCTFVLNYGFRFHCVWNHVLMSFSAMICPDGWSINVTVTDSPPSMSKPPLGPPKSPERADPSAGKVLVLPSQSRWASPAEPSFSPVWRYMMSAVVKSASPDDGLSNVTELDPSESFTSVSAATTGSPPPCLRVMMFPSVWTLSTLMVACGAVWLTWSPRPSTNVPMTAAKITVIATIRMTPITGETAPSSSSSCLSFVVMFCG